MPRLPSVQAELAALALALGGGALLLLIRLGAHLLARRRAGVSGHTAALLWSASSALGDLALLLDGSGRIMAASAAARRRLFGGADPTRRSVEEVLGPDATLLRRGLGRAPSTARLALGSDVDNTQAVLLRVSTRPVRDLLVLRPDVAPLPPPLPLPDEAAARTAARARADLEAVGAALLRPVERAATAAGLLRLSLPGAAGNEELRRIEAELADVERRVRWLHAAGRDLPRHEGPVDLAALVGELVGNAVPAKARLRAQLTPARAWADAGRLRTALREVLRAAAGDLPAGAELWVRVGARGGRAVLELATAAEATEATALARALVVPEGGEVEVEARAGRGGICRILLPAPAG